MELVPIKVKIGLRANGHADHPNWGLLPLAASEDPATHMHHGWKYDKSSGHTEATSDSPIGMQWGVVLVTPKFATEALAVFPALVTVLTEPELAAFWEQKVHAHLSDCRYDPDVLVSLKAERDLREAIGESTAALDQRIRRALNPDDVEPGIRRNLMKTWAQAKQRLDVKIVAP